MPYHHLSAMERGSIEALRKQGMGPAAIARQLGRSPSTISRELRRNRASAGRYDASQAHKRYKRERKNCRRSRSLDYPEFIQ